MRYKYAYNNAYCYRGGKKNIFCRQIMNLRVGGEEQKFT